FLVYQRDDLKGNQVIRGYTYLGGALKPVLEVMAPQLYTAINPSQILCSEKETPKDATTAEHGFIWDETQSLFVDKVVVQSAGTWAGSSIRVATPVPATAPVVVSAATPEKVAMVSKKSANGWWDEPLDAQASLLKLKNEIVPDRIKNNKIIQLGQEATAFFQVIHKNGVGGKDFASMRATYYAAV